METGSKNRNSFQNRCREFGKRKVSGNTMLCSLASLMVIVLIFMLVMYSIRLRIVNEAAIQIEDGLAASCLAGLYVDQEVYKATFLNQQTDTVIKDIEKSYQTFCSTLCTNLRLAEPVSHDYQNLKVKQYIIYNVYSNDETGASLEDKRVQIFSFDENGLYTSVEGIYGMECAPNGIPVMETCIFAEVVFQTEIWGGKMLDCHKQLLTAVRKR